MNLLPVWPQFGELFFADADAYVPRYCGKL